MTLPDLKDADFTRPPPCTSSKDHRDSRLILKELYLCLNGDYLFIPTKAGFSYISHLFHSFSTSFVSNPLTNTLSLPDR